MSDAAPLFARDYYSASVIARYGYYGSVLRPGMTDAQIVSAINALQSSTGGPLNQPFVAELDDKQIDAFIADYEIVASAADNAQAQSAGLDVLVLRACPESC